MTRIIFFLLLIPAFAKAQPAVADTIAKMSKNQVIKTGSFKLKIASSSGSGFILINADSTGTPTGGYLFKDFGTGEIKLGPGGSGSGSSSNYVPTITGISNVSSTTLTKAHYYPSGSHIQVYVYLSIDPTTVGTTEIAISLPASSELAAGDLFGVGNCSIAAQSGIVTTDATNNRATFIYTATDTGSADFVLIFTYEEILP